MDVSVTGPRRPGGRVARQKGTTGSSGNRQAGALEEALPIAPILSELAGMSARSVAAELNERQVETPSDVTLDKLFWFIPNDRAVVRKRHVTLRLLLHPSRSSGTRDARMIGKRLTPVVVGGLRSKSNLR